MKFKVGDRVICKSGATYPAAIDKVGTVLGLIGLGAIGVQYDECIGGHDCGSGAFPSGKLGHCMWNREDELELVTRKYPAIVITTNGTTTTAKLWNGKEIMKTATAKCSPADTFDHATGARLALDRLFGIEPVKQEVREVKRHAKPGEYIKIVAENMSYGDYSDGEIHKVVNLRNDRGDVRIDVPDSGYVSPDEYVVLENYAPDNA